MNAKIMVVDDDPGILALLEIILKRKGFTVSTAPNAYRAFALLEREKPDLFVLDVMMPGISGIELCKQLRARSETSQTPIILLSGWSEAEAEQRGYAAAANDYLSKTTPHSLIVSRIEKLLNHTRQQLVNAV